MTDLNPLSAIQAIKGMFMLYKALALLSTSLCEIEDTGMDGAFPFPFTPAVTFLNPARIVVGIGGSLPQQEGGAEGLLALTGMPALTTLRTIVCPVTRSGDMWVGMEGAGTGYL